MLIHRVCVFLGIGQIEIVRIQILIGKDQVRFANHVTSCYCSFLLRQLLDGRCIRKQKTFHWPCEILVDRGQFSINLLVVYRESVNLIGYLTRRLSADSLQL